MTIPDTLKLRDKLEKALRRAALYRSPLEPEIIRRIVEVVHPLTEMPPQHIRAGLAAWPPGELLEPDIQRMSLWFAGAIHDGRIRPLALSPSIATAERVGVQIQDWKGKAGGDTRLTFKVLQGSAAGHVFSRRMSLKFLSLISRELGFSRRRRWNGHPGEFTLLWLQVELESQKDGSLGFRRYHVPAHCKTHNQAIIRERDRPCVLGYRWLCTACPIGYDQCFRGTHAKTFPVHSCSNTATLTVGMGDWSEIHSGHFDPEGSSPVCMECRLTGRMKNDNHGAREIIPANQAGGGTAPSSHGGLILEAEAGGCPGSGVCDGGRVSQEREDENR